MNAAGKLVSCGRRDWAGWQCISAALEQPFLAESSCEDRGAGAAQEGGQHDGLRAPPGSGTCLCPAEGTQERAEQQEEGVSGDGEAGGQPAGGPGPADRQDAAARRLLHLLAAGLSPGLGAPHEAGAPRPAPRQPAQDPGQERLPPL